MRILVLTHEFPPVGGGGGRAAEDICKELSKRGHEIVVLTSHFKGLEYEETRDGIRIIRLRALRAEAYRASFLSMATYVLCGLWVALRFVRRWRPDVIHVHFAVPAGSLAWALSRWTHIPYVLTAHLGDVPGGVPEKTEAWFRWIYPLTPPIWQEASKVIAVSRYTRQLAQKAYRISMEVITNGVDLAMLDPGEIHIHNPPRIAFAGRFMPQKNPMRIVETLAALRDLSWECVMLGDGPLFGNVGQAIAHYGLEKRFTLPGWVTPQQVIGWFGTCDLLFMPSLSEGLPVVGVQGLAKGLAIVASRVGGFVDLVEHGKNGFLIAPQDTKGMVEAFRVLLTDNSFLLRARNSSRELAHRFDLTAAVDRYESVLREASSIQ
jgi:glycosyltransferase involved in cell wall biosynthesis